MPPGRREERAEAFSFVRRMPRAHYICDDGRTPSRTIHLSKMTKKKKSAPAGIQLGSLVKDTISGFTGIAVGRTEFGFGCIHIRIQAKGLGPDGAPIPIHSFDDQRIEVLGPPTRTWPQPRETAIRLGNFVRDSVTGTVGIVIGKTTNLEGNTILTLEHTELAADGQPKALLSAAPERLVVIDRRELKVSKDSVATSGGPMPERMAHNS